MDSQIHSRDYLWCLRISFTVIVLRLGSKSILTYFFIRYGNYFDNILYDATAILDVLTFIIPIIKNEFILDRHYIYKPKLENGTILDAH